MAKKKELHPTILRVKEGLSDLKLRFTEFRKDTTIISDRNDTHPLLRFLRDDPECSYDLLSDVTAVDYLNYPTSTIGRFAVIWNLVNTQNSARIFVKSFLDPTMNTLGIDDDPGLHIDTSTDIWPGAEWREREVYDMFGIYFDGHPDLRRILLWKDYPAFPLRKDYPLKGRLERDNLSVVKREDA